MNHAAVLTAQLCDLEQVTAGLCALVLLLVNQHRALDPLVSKETEYFQNY